MINEVLTWFVAAAKAEPTLAGIGGRIFPDGAKEGTANPCLVFQLIGGDAEEVVDSGPLDHGTVAIQIRIYDGSRISANALRESFRQAFQGLEPVEIGSRWRVEGTSWGELADTYDPEMKEYGALGVLEIHVDR